MDELRGSQVSALRAEGALAAVIGASSEAGYDTTGARIRRVGTSVLVDLPAAGVLARFDDVAGGTRARRQVLVARALAEAAVPAVRLVGPAEQPVAVHAGDQSAAVTLWHCETHSSAHIGATDMGRIARALHDAEPALPVPPLAPLEAVTEQIAVASAVGGSTTAELDLLGELHERMAEQWPLASTGRQGLVHGDLHVGNVIATPEGVVLCDLELAGQGPVAYDLVPQTVAVARYGAPETDLKRFEAAYGEPVPPAARSGLLVEVYELWLTAWAVANRNLDRAHDQEARRRLARWQGDQNHEPWRIL